MQLRNVPSSCKRNLLIIAMIYFLGDRKEIEECSGKVAHKYGSKAESGCDLVRAVSHCSIGVCIKVRTRSVSCAVPEVQEGLPGQRRVRSHLPPYERGGDARLLQAERVSSSAIQVMNSLSTFFFAAAKLTGQGMVCVVITAVEKYNCPKQKHFF